MRHTPDAVHPWIPYGIRIRAALDFWNCRRPSSNTSRTRLIRRALGSCIPRASANRLGGTTPPAKRFKAWLLEHRTVHAAISSLGVSRAGGSSLRLGSPSSGTAEDYRYRWRDEWPSDICAAYRRSFCSESRSESPVLPSPTTKKGHLTRPRNHRRPVGNRSIRKRPATSTRANSATPN